MLEIIRFRKTIPNYIFKQLNESLQCIKRKNMDFMKYDFIHFLTKISMSDKMVHKNKRQVLKSFLELEQI